MKALAAISLNRIIGNAGKIPWSCRADLLWFKEFSLNKKIVMGRTTFNDMPFLPNREVYVLASRPICPIRAAKYHEGKLSVISDIDFLPKDCIVAGGAKVYETLLPYCRELYISIIKKVVEGDTEMPPYAHLFKDSELIHDDAERSVIKYSK